MFHHHMLITITYHFTFTRFWLLCLIWLCCYFHSDYWCNTDVKLMLEYFQFFLWLLFQLKICWFTNKNSLKEVWFFQEKKLAWNILPFCSWFWNMCHRFSKCFKINALNILKIRWVYFYCTASLNLFQWRTETSFSC